MARGVKTHVTNVYYYQTPREARDGIEGTYLVAIQRAGRWIIRKGGFKTPEEAGKAGDLALIKAGLPQLNGTFKFVEKSSKKTHTEGFAY